MYELELKWRVGTFDKVRLALQQLNGVCVRVEVERDLFFNHPSRNFFSTGEVLRLRRTNRGVTLTYKGSERSDSIKAREEYEIRVDDFDTALKLLEKLGFSRALTLEKRREVWSVRGMTVCLDQVEELGRFIEIEGFAKSLSEFKQVELKIRKLASELGLDPDKGIKESYVTMLLRRKRERV
ncbi:class IV adenylate cyclase [archaeon]|nr:class IV adenylate cyclase [archaeon]